MKIIEPGFEFINEPDALKKIELCGRVCYKSENKITDSSAEKFVTNLIRRGHESVLEHVQIIIRVDELDVRKFDHIRKDIYDRFGWRCLLRMTRINGRYIISGNVRMWRDFMRDISQGVIFTPLAILRGVLFDDVNKTASEVTTTAKIITADQLITDGEKDAHATETVRIICDRGISHEIVRHRTASFSQESTRYCNYSGEVTFIRPPFFDGILYNEWEKSVIYAELAYNLLISKGAKPQEARAVLPNSLKTELIMTATRDSWKHFFELRTSPAAHPQIKQIAEPMKTAFEERW